jgi:hypothetical protein
MIDRGQDQNQRGEGDATLFSPCARTGQDPVLGSVYHSGRRNEVEAGKSRWCLHFYVSHLILITIARNRNARNGEEAVPVAGTE